MKKFTIASFLLAVPSLAFAAADFELAGKNFKDVVGYVISIIFALNPVLFSLAFIVFFWGLSKFILNSNKPEEIKNGRTYMLWAVFALFILLTFRTIIGMVSSDLEIGSRQPNENTILLPTN